MRRRRHRFVTVPSGWLLLFCLFLPALKFCDGSLPMAVVPIAWPPAGLGAVVAMAAMSNEIVAYAGVLTWYIRINVIAWSAWLIYSAADAGAVTSWLAIPLAIGVLLWFVTIGRRTEAASARIATVASATVALMTGLVLMDSKVLWGMYVAFGAACALTLGAIWWWIEAYADSR